VSSKKHKVLDRLVDLCIIRDGIGKKSYIFNNLEVKEIAREVGFGNPFDATHIDTSRKLSPRMVQEDLALLHLGTPHGEKSANHMFIRGIEKIYQPLPFIENESKINYIPGPLDQLNTSESNILSMLHNHNILLKFLYPNEIESKPHMYMSHRTKYSPRFTIGTLEVQCNKLQIEIDMTLEDKGSITVFEAKNWISGRNDFAVYQLYHPFLHYYSLMEAGELDVQEVNCCYAVRKKTSDGVQIDIYLFTFDEPLDMSSIRLLRSHSYLLLKTK
jgi:hypothetical protein